MSVSCPFSVQSEVTRGMSGVAWLRKHRRKFGCDTRSTMSQSDVAVHEQCQQQAFEARGAPLAGPLAA